MVELWEMELITTARKHKPDAKPFQKSLTAFWESTVHHFVDNWVWCTLFQGAVAERAAGNHLFPHGAWGLSVILTDMSFQGNKMYQIGSPDKSWQTNQGHTEIRIETWELPVTVIGKLCRWLPAKQQKEMSALDRTSWVRKCNSFFL